MRKTIRMMGIALVVWGLSAGAASSATTVISFTDNTLSGGGFEATFGTNPVLGAFVDHFTFSPTAAMAGSGGGSLISGFGFTGPSVLFTSYDLIDTTAAVTVASGVLFPIPSFTGVIAFSALDTTHEFDLVVTGDLAPNFNSGSYTGNLSISPVPEPETYAMLLVGLGLIGFAARRRNRNFN